MITQEDILDAITEEACKALPQLQRIYIDLIPAGFLRPSLLIQPVSESPEQANRGTLHVTAYFTLTIFDETDDYANSDTRRLVQWQHQLRDLFRAGHLRVKDRTVAVLASTGGRDWDKAYVEVQLEYYENRSDTVDTTPKMEQIETTVNLKG